MLLGRRLVIGSIAGGLVLGGCGGGGPAPIAKPRFLLVRSGDSPVLDELRKTFRQEAYTGSQDPSRYRVVVFDGDAHSPQELASHPLMRAALERGVSVMLLDVTEDHKANLTRARITQAHTSDGSAAYLITPLPGGRITHLTNLRRTTRLKTRTIQHVSNPNGIVEGQHRTSEQELPIAGHHLATYMDAVYRRLEFQGRGTVNAPTPPSDYPSHCWFQTSVTDTWASGAVSDMNNQSLSHNVTYNYYVYFDSGASLQSHWFIWCAMTMDGTVSPSAPARNDSDHRGWAHTLFDALIFPNNQGPGNGLQLALVEAQPTSAQNSLASSLEFDIGYRSTQGNTAWNWQQTVSQQSPNFNGWAASAPPPFGGQINAVSLQEMQTSPYDGDGSNWESGFDKGFSATHVKSMNSTSTSQIEVLGQAAWKTFDVFSGIVQINSWSSSLMMYLHVSNHFLYSNLYRDTLSFQTDGVLVNLDFSQVSAP